jgi:hypothetical protein
MHSWLLKPWCVCVCVQPGPVPPEWGQAPSLQVLSLEDNPINGGDDLAPPLVQGFFHSRVCQLMQCWWLKVCLTRGVVSHIDAGSLPAEWAASSSLWYLLFRGNNLTGVDGVGVLRFATCTRLGVVAHIGLLMS